MTAEQALERYQALLELEKVTRNSTRRTRDELIRQLGDADLMEFALRAKNLGVLLVNSK